LRLVEVLQSGVVGQGDSHAVRDSIGGRRWAINMPLTQAVWRNV
jgi:hypothetical protein